MDLKQLEAFAAVVRLGSFSGAARALFLTQPTISAHVRALELELGTQLVQRSARGASPTENGNLLYGYAVDMLALRDAALAACGGEASQPAGRLTICASSVPYRHVLPRLMTALRGQHPGLSFCLLGGDSRDVAQAVRTAQAELGVAGADPQDPALLCQPFMQDELVVAAPPQADGLPKEGEEFLLETLAHTPLILRPEGSGTRRETEAMLAARGLEPGRLQVAAVMDDADAIQSAVSRGLGVSILSRLEAGDMARRGLLRVYRLEGAPLLRNLYLIRRKNAPLSAAGQAFWRLAQSNKF